MITQVWSDLLCMGFGTMLSTFLWLRMLRKVRALRAALEAVCRECVQENFWDVTSEREQSRSWAMVQSIACEALRRNR